MDLNFDLPSTVIISYPCINRAEFHLSKHTTTIRDRNFEAEFFQVSKAQTAHSSGRSHLLTETQLKKTEKHYLSDFVKAKCCAKLESVFVSDSTLEDRFSL
jgi:hypothetical protein